MSKINIKMLLNDDIFIYEGIKSKNSIIFKEKDILVKINILDEIQLIRENDEYKLELFFSKNSRTKGKYFLKKYNKYIDLFIDTKKILITDNSLEIIYNISDNSEQVYFKIEFEEI